MTTTHPHLEGLIRKWRAEASDYRYVAEPSAPDRAEELEAAADELEAAIAAGGVGIVGWLHEDTLPDGYPYDAMFPHSKVDGVRMFPVYAPLAQALAALPGGGVDDLEADFDTLVEHNIDLQSVILDAIKIHGSFNTTADMADWLRDALETAALPTPTPHEADQ